MSTTLHEEFPFAPEEDPAHKAEIAKLAEAKADLMSGEDFEGFDKWGDLALLLNPRGILSWNKISPQTFDAAEKARLKAVTDAVPFDVMPPQEVAGVRAAVHKAVAAKIGSIVSVASSRSHTLRGSTFVAFDQPDTVERMQAVWQRLVDVVGDEATAKLILADFNASVVELGAKVNATPLEELLNEAEQIRLAAIHLLAESRKKKI